MRLEKVEHSDTLSLRISQPLAGSVQLPGDKSISHRAALFAALAEGNSKIERFLVSGVTNVMLTSLRKLGVKWELHDTTLLIEGKGLRGFTTPDAPLDCGNSGTTMRMLGGALAAAGMAATLDGSKGLRLRPMDRIITPLSEMGVKITSNKGYAPLCLTSRTSGEKLKPINYTLPFASAQVKSTLILAALAAADTTVLSEPGFSRDHTERMLRSMGASITNPAPLQISVAPLTQPLTPLNIALPGDISSAAFLLVAAAIVPGSSITLPTVGINPSRTGILDALSAMGAKITITDTRDMAGEPIGTISLEYAPLKGISISGDLVIRMIDEFPALAIAACFADGTTEVRDAKELRYKETDRITDMCTQLRALGCEVEEFPDGFKITGHTLQGGECQALQDHRLAMSLAVAGVAAPQPVCVHGTNILHESFPDFLPALQSLGVQAL